MKNDKRKIMILGGAFTQIPAIEYAKSAGYHVITCDYRPDSPGHKISDEYHNISTIDMEAILNKAKELKIDGILGFASDYSAATAAYISDKLNLPGPSYESVNILRRKDIFRKLQVDNDLNSVKFHIVEDNEVTGLYKDLDFPVVVKPVDSTGSKGVVIVYDEVDFNESVEKALSYSICNKCIVEEYIDTSHHQLHGDGFVFDGKLVFLGLCDQYHNNMAPLASVYPPTVSNDILVKTKCEIEKALNGAGYEYGGINVEVRIGLDDEIYIVEINPRCGSNYIPQLMKCGTGFDEVKAAVETAMGKKIEKHEIIERKNCLLYFLIAQNDGILDRINLEGEISEHIKHVYTNKKSGDTVHKHRSGADIVAFLIAGYENGQSLEKMMNELYTSVVLRT